MRRSLALLAILVPGLVWAQDYDAAKAVMNGAIAELATHSRLTINLTGIETDGTKKTPIGVSLALETFLVDSRPVPFIEVMDFKNDQVVSRSAGDGQRFWNYVLSNKTYTSVDYGTAPFVGKEKDRLYQNLVLRSKGAQAFVARLMKDTYVGGEFTRANWAPWRPNSTVTFDSAGNVVCTSVQPNLSRLTYVLSRDSFGAFILTGAEYYEESSISGRLRTTTWSMAIVRDEYPKGTSFQFVPPAGSRSVSVNETRGGF